MSRGRGGGGEGEGRRKKVSFSCGGVMAEAHVLKDWVTCRTLGMKERRWFVLRNTMLSCFDSDVGISCGEKR